MKIKCPLCDFENEEGNKFCANCNEPLFKQGYSEDNPYTKEARNEDQPFELISDEEAYEITRKSKRKVGFKLFSKKTLIILVILVAISAAAIISNYLLESKNEEKTTMDIIYENMKKSMKNEDIELIQELTSKAIQLLPKNEKEKLIELQTRFGKYSYSSLTENETRLM